MHSLDEAFVQQYILQRTSFNTNPSDMTEEERAEWIRWNVLALTDELHEALGEVGWKPWASSRHLNREAYKGELVDAFHFFINLCLVARISAKELLDGYFAKRERNAERQSNGYTGLDKCPGCKRAWDDVEAIHGIVRFQSPSNQLFCTKDCWEATLAQERAVLEDRL